MPDWLSNIFINLFLMALWLAPPLLARQEGEIRRRETLSLGALGCGFLFLVWVGLMRYGWSAEFISMLVGILIYCGLVLLFTLEILRLAERPRKRRRRK